MKDSLALVRAACLFTVVVLGVATAACSSSSTEKESAPAADASTSGDAATTFECVPFANVSCSTGTDYCLVAVSVNMGVHRGGFCATRPASCTSCDCAVANAEAAWRARFDNNRYCTGAKMVCNQNGNQITVTCEHPS